MFKNRGCKYEPDLVTVWVGPNDLKKVYTLNDRELLAWRRSRRYLVGSRVRDFLEWFHSYRTVSDILRRTAADPPAVEKGAQTRVSLDDYRKNLAALNKLCQQRGSTLLLISPARRKDRYVAQETIDYRRALDEVARKEHIPLFALVEMTEEAAAPNAAFFMDAVHPNPKGYALIAQKLAEFLWAQGFLKASGAE
jgi:lysophospholipase L1-like esterase